MDIKSIHEQVLTNKDQNGLYDLFDMFIFMRPDIPLDEYEVKEYEEMRIDLVFQNIYIIEPNEIGIYLENIDVLLAINNIDNPLNIKRGMIIKYPSFDNLGSFRYKNDDFSSIKKKTTPLLAVPNLSTKKDISREKYKEAGYSLPPVVLSTPKPPVKIENGKIKVGGL